MRLTGYSSPCLVLNLEKQGSKVSSLKWLRKRPKFGGISHLFLKKAEEKGKIPPLISSNTSENFYQRSRPRPCPCKMTPQEPLVTEQKFQTVWWDLLRIMMQKDTLGPRQSEFLWFLNSIKRILNKFTKPEEWSDKIYQNCVSVCAIFLRNKAKMCGHQKKFKFQICYEKFSKHYRRAQPFNLPAHPFHLLQIAFCW